MLPFKVPERLRSACVRFERAVQFRWTVYRYGLWVAPISAGYSLLASPVGWSTPWLIELASHFVWPSTVVAAAVAVLLKPARKATAAAAVAGLALLSYAASQSAPGAVENAGATPLIVATANVRLDNLNTAALGQWLDETQAEVVGVQEVSPHWRTALEALKPQFPHQRILARNDAFGIALLSKWPLQDVAVLGEEAFLPPSLMATVTKHGSTFRVAVIHPLPPGSPTSYKMQVEQLALVSDWVTASPAPTWVMGDLNATPWSAPYQQLHRAGLRSASPLTATWPAHWGGPLQQVGLPGLPFLPIDHILVRGLRVDQVHRGPHVGSDHRPMAARLWVDAAAAQPPAP